MKPAPPVLAVVIGTHNRLDQLRRCIDSIVRETSVPFVIHVTDGGSTDGTIGYLQSIASDVVRPVFVGELVGQAKAYNDVFMRLDADYVAWLSDDNEVVDKGLDVAVSVLQAEPRFGMVGLKVRDVEGPFVDAPYGGGISSIGVLNVNQGVLPTTLLKGLGGFSETFRFYGIDPDLTARVLFSGWDVCLTRKVAVRHYRNWSTEKGSPAWKAMKKTQRLAAQLYNAKYGALHFPSVRYAVKRRVFGVLQRAFPEALYINAPGRALGFVPRDLYNLFNGRFISLLDPVRTAGKPYHLVQHCPQRSRPPTLPPEPPGFAR